MVESKKYWLKLNKDFLKSPQIKVIKNLPNGKDYIIFYLALMLESVETVGHLKFTSFVPYNAEMLAAITDTNIDIVRSATKLFCELGLMQIFDDGTIFLPQVPSITGKECDSAERVRNYRNKQKMLQCNSDVTKCNPNIYIDKDKDKNKEKEKSFKKPTLEEVKQYCLERHNGIDAEKFIDSNEAKGWMIGKNKMKDWKAAIRTWERNQKEWNKQQEEVSHYRLA